MFNVGSVIFSVLIIISLPIYFSAGSLCIGKHNTITNATGRYFPIILQRSFFIQPEKAVYENNGETVVVKFSFEDRVPSIEGGPFGKEQYLLNFMYYQWLDASIEEEVFPAELHAVWINRRYGDYEAALKKNLAVAITTFRYVVDDEYSVTYSSTFFDNIEYIINPFSKIETVAPNTVIFPSVLRIGTMYNMYVGKSIFGTNPSCDSEADVIWIESGTRVTITPTQVIFFNKLSSKSDLPLMSNIQLFSPPNSTIYKTINYKSKDGEQLNPIYEGLDFEFNTASITVVCKCKIVMPLWFYIFVIFKITLM